MSARPAAAPLFAVCVALGCGRDVAQTAERAPSGSDAPSCAEAPGPSALPTSGPFGGGGEPRSALVGTAYRAGQGPGLYVLARDAFRVYLNGALVREGGAARAAEFVPLTLLPGDNVLAVVVAASDGAPAALVQLDELDRSTVSDARWKASTAPAPGFHDATYDDSSWPAANDFGAADALAGCSAAGVFPADSRARWIGPAPGASATAVLRTVVRIRPVGFGESTTGGLGATPVTVSTWEELEAAARDEDAPAVILLAEGVHDFREPDAEAREQPVCPAPCANDSARMTYTALVDGETCPVPLVTRTRNDRRLSVGPNKTLVGLGRGAALRGVSIEIGAVENVIVRNVAVFDVNPGLIEAGDAFGLSAPNRVWLDHCTAKWVSDGFTDARAGTQNVTVSWLRYDGTNAEACAGRHERTSQLSDTTVTFHHTLFTHVESHSPLADHPNARMHVFNSFLSDNPDYGVGAACGAEVLIEGNVFENVAAPTLRIGCPDDAQLGRMLARPGSNLYREGVGAHRGGDGLEPRDAVFTPPYAYELDAPQEAWPAVLSRAGAGGPWALPLTLD